MNNESDCGFDGVLALAGVTCCFVGVSTYSEESKLGLLGTKKEGKGWFSSD